MILIKRDVCEQVFGVQDIAAGETHGRMRNIIVVERQMEHVSRMVQPPSPSRNFLFDTL